MGTIGNTKIGDYLLPDTNWNVASRFNLPTEQTITQFAVYIGACAGYIVVGIYDDDGPNGDPGTLLWTAERTIAGETDGWKAFGLRLHLMPGNYWFCILRDLATPRYDIGVAGQCVEGYGNPLPNPFGTIYQRANWAVSMYAIYGFEVNVAPTSAQLQVGGSVTFTATPLGGVSPYTIRWIDNVTKGQIGTGATFLFNATQAGNFEIYAEVTDSQMTIATSAVIPITVTAPPPVSHLLAVNSLPIGAIPFTIERLS